jgi:hypothetical protein
VIEFRELNLTAPGASVIGVIGEGTCSLAGDAVRFKPGDAIPQTVGDYILDHTLAMSDSLAKSKVMAQLLELRNAGATIVLISHDEPLLESCADEIWWLRDNKLVAKGDPSEVLASYHAHIAKALRSEGDNQLPRVSPSMRQGDGRAVIEQIELLGEHGQPCTVWRSGERVMVAVSVRFAAPVADPVVGIMIRTRVGLNVYGTNTELEHLKLGPIHSGERLRVTYQFECQLCPGQYTITAASHDPDGLWHDWMEDAVAFSVTDARYTAGVANLRSTVESARV